MRGSHELILAIDQGTSAIKVVLFDLQGRAVAEAGAETLLRHPQPTWVESDAEAWWAVAATAIRAVLGQLGAAGGRVCAIGLCGFMHTLVPVDYAGRALYPPMLWPDQRSSAEAEALSRHADLFTRVTGRVPTTMYAAPRLLWLRAHHPEALARAQTYLLSKDILRLRLTGQFATDRHDALGTGLVDHSTGGWSEEVLDLLGIPVDRMPPILRCDEVAGVVTGVAARETGLQQGTPVVVGSGDWFTTLVGSGCCLPERICFYLGTAGILGAFASADDLDRLGTTRYFGSVTSTGSALRWARDLFSGPAPGPLLGDADAVSTLPFSQLCAEAESSEPGARGLLFLPHLMGERGGAPRPHARGAIYGLTLAHRRPDILRAVLEGTAFWLRATGERYLGEGTPGEFVAFGGGARSRLWRRIFAATFRRRLLIPEVVDGGALGAAKLAAVGTGLRRSYRELGEEWTRIAEVEEPDSELAERYDDAYRDFLRLEEALVPLDRLAAEKQSGRRPPTDGREETGASG